MLTKSVIVLPILLLIFIGALTEASKKDDSLLKHENITVEIHHCTSCGYRAKAFSLAEELNKEFGIEAKLVDGEAGSFNVFVNGELIFSKYEAGRFPNPGEIVQKINEYMKK